MRSRNIKPGFFSNEDLLECEPLARILFAGLWCLADREGRLEDRPKKIKIELLPCDNCDTDALLQQLAAKNLIVRYEVGEIKYIQISGFLKHQKPHVKEASSVIPAQGWKPMPVLEGSGEHLPRQEQTTTGAVDDPSSCLNPSSLNPECSTSVEAHAPAVSFPSFPPDFKQFWAAYPPNGSSEHEASKAYETARRRGATHTEIIKGTKVYLEFLKSKPDGFEFVTNAAKWLREKAWTVEYHKLRPKGTTNGFHAASAGEKLEVTPEKHKENRQFYLEKGIQHPTYNPEGITVKEASV